MTALCSSPYVKCWPLWPCFFYVYSLFNPHNTPVNWVLFPHVGANAAFLEAWNVCSLGGPLKRENQTNQHVQPAPAALSTRWTSSWKETSVQPMVVKLSYSYKLHKNKKNFKNNPRDHINTLPKLSCVGVNKSYPEAHTPQKTCFVCPFHG